MSMDEKPLPKPPKTPFGRQKQEEQEQSGPLFADRIAAAKMEGRVEEFLEAELPDNEQMRRLVSLMMGMTGLGPLEDVTAKREVMQDQSAGATQRETDTASGEVPEDVREAIQSGDVQGLMEMLRREHQKRTGTASAGEAVSASPEAEAPAALEKEVLDRLIRISSQNNLSVDWLIMRAMKLYVEEYDKTGRL